MKRLGFLFALIAVLAIAGSAMAGSWDVRLSADVNGTKGLVAKTVEVTIVSGDATKGKWTLNSKDLTWWTVSTDLKATSYDFTKVVSGNATTPALSAKDVIYVTSKDAVSKDFNASLVFGYTSADAMGKGGNIVVTPTHYAKFSLIFTPDIAKSGWSKVSFDGTAAGSVDIATGLAKSSDMAITFNFTVVAPPVAPKSLEKEDVVKILATDGVTASAFDATTGAANKNEATKKANKVLSDDGGKEVKTMETFPMFRATGVEAPGVTFKIASLDLFPKDTVKNWTWFVNSADALYKVIPSGDVAKLMKKTGASSVDLSAEGDCVIEGYYFYIYVGDASGDFTTTGKKYDFDKTKGSVVDPFVAIETKKKGNDHSSGGGCTAAYAPFALVLAAPLFFLRKKD